MVIDIEYINCKVKEKLVERKMKLNWWQIKEWKIQPERKGYK